MLLLKPQVHGIFLYTNQPFMVFKTIANLAEEEKTQIVQET